jgi:hypothetical protein
VQDDPNRRQPVRSGMLSYPSRRSVRRCWCDGPWLASPALIGMFVHIAMVTGQITATVHFQDILRDEIRHHEGSDGGAEHRNVDA